MSKIKEGLLYKVYVNKENQNIASYSNRITPVHFITKSVSELLDILLDVGNDFDYVGVTQQKFVIEKIINKEKGKKELKERMIGEEILFLEIECGFLMFPKDKELANILKLKIEKEERREKDE